MKRILVISFLLCLSLTLVQAQNPGDKAAAGYSYNRANLNPDIGNFKPPFKDAVPVELPGIQDAQTLNVFENYLLVGENGNPGNYTLIEATPWGELWSREFPEQDSGKILNPSYANGVALLTGGTASTVLQAIDIETGEMIWEDAVGTDWQGRDPLIMSEMAFYHDEAKVNAVQAATGTVVWSLEVSTAAAPLAVFGDQLYFSTENTVTAVDITDGTILWQAIGFGGDGCRILPTQRNVFVANPGIGVLAALDSYSGAEAWSAGYPAMGTNPIAAAYGFLYVFYSDGSNPMVTALDQITGETIWEKTDPSDVAALPDHGQVANGHVYFYNSGSERIRILDAFNGNTVWSIQSSGVKDLAINDQYLFGLRADQVDVHVPVNMVYLSHIAEGLDPINSAISISTMFVINNGDEDPSTATMRMFKSNGTPMEVTLGTLDGTPACPPANPGCDPNIPVSEIPLEIAGNRAVSFATTGSSENLTVGWAEVESDSPLSATSIFRTKEAGTILFEAGVGAAELTSNAVFFVTSNNYESTAGYNTAIALVNPMNEDAEIEVNFTSSDGAESVSTSIILPAGNHTATFLNTPDGLFPSLSGVELTGSLSLSSDLPFAAAALRTQMGFQMSSYPMATPQK